MKTKQVFETIACPICSAPEFDVVRESQYPASITAEDLSKLYSASSSHVLRDQVVRCRSCSMQYVNPRPDPEIITDSYAAAEDPTFVEHNDKRIKAFHETLVTTLSRLKGYDPKGKRLLDVGCAGGAFPAAAREFGFDVVGVEPSRWMADYGRRTYGLNIIDGLLVPGMFPEQSFDVITLWDVVEHVPDPSGLLKLIRKLLKPNGILMVNYPDVGSNAARLLGRRWPFWLSVHLLYYDRKTIKKQLDSTGFDTLWYDSCWPTLPVGYILHRAVPYFGVLRVVESAANATGLAKVSLKYNIGQTLVVCRKNNAE